MPTTPLGIWTPDDSDDWDLTVDLAAMAVSIDSAIDNGINAIPKNYLVGTNAERLALSGSDLFEGLRVWTTDTKILWLYTNGAWKPLATADGSAFASAAGELAVAGGAGTNVSFPAGRFTVPPEVTVTAFNNGSVMVPHVTSRTKDGFNLRLFLLAGATGAAGNASWHAVQMTPTSAAG